MGDAGVSHVRRARREGRRPAKISQREKHRDRRALSQAKSFATRRRWFIPIHSETPAHGAGGEGNSGAPDPRRNGSRRGGQSLRRDCGILREEIIFGFKTKNLARKRARVFNVSLADLPMRIKRLI